MQTYLSVTSAFSYFYVFRVVIRILRKVVCAEHLDDGKVSKCVKASEQLVMHYLHTRIGYNDVIQYVFFIVLVFFK